MSEQAKPARDVKVETPGQVVAAVEIEKAPEPVANDQVKPKHRLREAHDYRNMRAHEVDPHKITSPVLTLDGYVCPAPAEKK